MQTLFDSQLQYNAWLHVSEQFPTRVLSCDSLEEEAYRHNSCTSLAFTENEKRIIHIPFISCFGPFLKRPKQENLKISWKTPFIQLVHQTVVHLDILTFSLFLDLIMLSWKIWLSKKQSFETWEDHVFSTLMPFFGYKNLKAHHQCTSHILVVQQQQELDQHLWCSVNAQFGIGLLALGCWVERVVSGLELPWLLLYVLMFWQCF